MGTLVALPALNALIALRTHRPLDTLGAGGALKPLDTHRSLHALHAVLALRACCPGVPYGTCPALRALNSLGAVVTLNPLRALSSDGALKPLRTGHALHT